MKVEESQKDVFLGAYRARFWETVNKERILPFYMLYII